MTFEFPVQISLIPVLIGLGILIIGVVLFAKVNKVLGIMMSTFAMFFLILFGPTLFLDRVEVSPVGIKQSTGFWFGQTEKEIIFADLSFISITEGRNLKNRSIELWVAEYKSGSRVEIDPGDLWESNGEEIIGYIEQLGIDIYKEDK